jgi:hypothetical protein
VANIGSFNRQWEKWLPWQSDGAILQMWWRLGTLAEIKGAESWCPVADQVDEDEDELEIVFTPESDYLPSAPTLPGMIGGGLSLLRSALRKVFK